MEEEVLFIKNVNLIIKTNLDNPNLKGNFIAKRLGINRMQLHRKLKEYIGQHARAYIIQIRMEHAKHLLLTTSNLIVEIALTCGYKDYRHFSKVFKKTIGCSPIDFRCNYGRF